ncbi:MAG: LPS assembly lipoprotein LptE [Pseudomonadota bacterium]
MSGRTGKILAAIAAALTLQSCGFQPLYATSDGSAPGLRNVALSTLTATEEIEPVLTRAFVRRTAPAASEAQYDLLISADEQSERLAVQIDASVTRYNYRLVGNYTLVERASGKKFKGRITSIASFNIVNSQYSTLYAEEAAREKAATQLVEDIERDILLKLAAARDDADKAKK